MATSAVVVLLLAACGGDDGSISSPSDPLRAPVPVNVTGVGSGVGAVSGDDGRAMSEMAADVAIDPAAPGSSSMGWWSVFEYVAGEGLPALPDASTAYQYPAGAEVGADEVARVASALGVEGDPVRSADPALDGVLWRVGPDDGTAPSLTVTANAELSWYYSGAWLAADDVVADGAGSSGREVTSEPGTGDGDVTDMPIDAPAPPDNVPTGEEALAEGRRLLGELGLDASGFEADVYADEWFASVTLSPTLGAARSPIGFGFGFGADTALEWAHGSLASPVPAGPYPLIDLDGALARLAEHQGSWGGAVALPEPLLVDTPVDDSMSDGSLVDPMPTEPQVDPMVDPMTVEPTEPEIVVATLVDVRADLWWAWDDDGSVWLLPAYTFTDSEGREHTIPAVADEYLIVPEPVVLEPAPEPLPEPGQPPEVVEPTDPVAGEPVDDVIPVEIETLVDAGGLIGLTITEAEDTLAAVGGVLRVARQDGDDLALTMDLRLDRVNVAVEGDVVTEVLSIG